MVLLFLRPCQFGCFSSKPLICVGHSPDEELSRDYLSGSYLSNMDRRWNGNRVDGFEPFMVRSLCIDLV